MRVYNQGELVAETSFLLRSDDWYLIKPSGTGSIVGDTLTISERTDIDSIVVSWGDSVKADKDKSGLGAKKTSTTATFSAFQVVPTPENQNYEYTMKLAQVTVPASHVSSHDTLITEDKKSPVKQPGIPKPFDSQSDSNVKAT